MPLPSYSLKKCSCIHCKTEVVNHYIERHAATCYLNPINLKACAVCTKPVKDFKNASTCSRSCANKHFRSGPNHPNWRDSNYVTTCFYYHKKECVVCGENLIVAVHHLDEDHHNNVPSNLIPLCPTHHTYWHSNHKDKIESTVIAYITKWKSDNPLLQ